MAKYQDYSEKKKIFPFEKDHLVTKKVEDDQKKFFQGDPSYKFQDVNAKDNDFNNARRIFLEKYVPLPEVKPEDKKP